MCAVKLICVLGPTACGKTRYAVGMARRMGGEIISADSRKVYRGMYIGTGKDLSDYGDVPYHLIDIADAGTKYDIFRYQKDFAQVYQNIIDRGRIPILCGGSGLYIESVTRGYSLPDVPGNPPLRAELEKYSDAELIAKLASLKTLHNKTDYDTRQRLIRALEIAIYQSEHPQEDIYHTSDGKAVPIPRFKEGEVEYIGLMVSREERNARIDARLDARLKEGMVDEVRGLLDSGIPAGNLLYYGLEYKFVTQYLLGEISYDFMREHLAIAIHQFAKRQMTWFRGMERRGIRIKWIEV
ncbi:MAG: tRNA (adenosine(37)-N6)-dimethylallyltransferase MiaA [Alistipes sp.]|nr:tRNA (adenosine(37)-N6)-dimethylallyltransferase MiaA [Candidatus Minthomonas equi]